MSCNNFASRSGNFDLSLQVSAGTRQQVTMKICLWMVKVRVLTLVVITEVR